MAAIRTVLGLSLLLVTVLATAALAQRPERRQYRYWGGAPTDRSHHTNLRTSEDLYPLNVKPEHVSVKDAPLGDGDLVLGIVINGEARAYPVNYMNGPFNEIVNDILGGQAIAPTW